MSTESQTVAEFLKSLAGDLYEYNPQYCAALAKSAEHVEQQQSRIAELERQAAIGRRAFDAAQVADAVESLVGWVGRNMDCGCTPLEIVRARALIKILRAAEQAGMGVEL